MARQSELNLESWKTEISSKANINLIKLVRLKSKISFDLINNKEKENNLNKDYNRIAHLV